MYSVNIRTNKSRIKFSFTYIHNFQEKMYFKIRYLNHIYVVVIIYVI